MLLTINVGNTNVGFGVFDGLRLVKDGRVAHADSALLPQRVGPGPFRRIVACSVAPSLNPQLATVLASSFSLPVEFAGADLPYGIQVECDEPDKVGADRVVNAIGAFARTRGAAVVVDVGTAVTVDLVSSRGDFCGGAIAPGPDTLARALHERAELLPSVKFGKPATPVGRNTQDAIRSGVYWGLVGMVDELVARVRSQSGVGTPVLLTGGGAEAVAADLHERMERVPALTLEGLAVLAARTASSS